MLPTTIPSEGVEQYPFAKTNVGEAIGKGIKKVAVAKADLSQINAKNKEEQKAIRAVRAEGRVARKNAKNAASTISGLEGISNISSQQFPSKPLSSSPKNRAAKARLTRQLNAKKAASNKPVPKGNTTPVFKEPTSAVQAVSSGRKKARQVRPNKETSLSVKRV